MKNEIAHRHVAGVAIVTLVAACIQLGTGWFNPPNALAQQGTQRGEGEWVVGIARGEVLRVIGVSNPWARKRDPVLMTFQIVNAYGAPLIEPVEMRVAHGAMAISDILRDAVNQQGEPGTGRIQVRVIYGFVAPAGSKPSDFVPLLEVFDLATGRTTQRTGPVADVLYSAAGNSADN